MDKNIVPATIAERERIVQLIENDILQSDLVPPVHLEELRRRAKLFLVQNDLDDHFEDWIIVHINNVLWRDIVASIHCEQRILLMPQCLKSSRYCKAPINEWGLECVGCKQCVIPDIQTIADAMGIMSIVSEGYTAVKQLIHSGEVKAVIGIACLESLEQVYPQLIANGIPAVAVPLNESNCIDTTVDRKPIVQYLSNYSQTIYFDIELEVLRNEVKELFTPNYLDLLMGESHSSTAQIARRWLKLDGKRWRPLLGVAVYQALKESNEFPISLKHIAVAIECFHKASLVHDDIEDNDQFRYGTPTIHHTYGIPIAINVGDLLLAEGYRMIAKSGNVRIVERASEAIADLCIGQGTELEWGRNPVEVTIEERVEMYRLKTATAFSIALEIGAICANADSDTIAILRDYANALGIAYQIKDDLEDEDYISVAELNQLYETYKRLSFETILPLKQIALKQLLFRIIGKIL